MQAICSIPDCEQPAKGRTWCAKHYARWLRNGGPEAVHIIVDPDRGCAVAGCDEPHYGKSYCRLHFRRWKKHGDPLAGARVKNTCSIDGCDKPATGRDWCHNHLRKWQRNGTPTPVPLTEEERFFARVAEGADGCWLWHKISDAGYGFPFAPVAGCHYLPHRWVYEFLIAEIPEGLVIDHLCENRACVNPWHLEPVTQQVNVLRGYRREASEHPPP